MRTGIPRGVEGGGDVVNHQRWRIECEDGSIREVTVSRLGDGWWHAFDGADDHVASPWSARRAALGLAAKRGMEVYAVLAPGQLTRAEVDERLSTLSTVRDRVESVLRERATAYQRLASTAMVDGDAAIRAAVYEDALRIVREETGR